MGSLTRVLVSLITRDNDFQKYQAAAAESAARNLGVEAQIVFANNSPVEQTQQLLESVQNPANRPAAILVEPVGTGMIKVAQAAVAAGIGWVILNRDVDYIGELRRSSSAPSFAVSADHYAVGQIQGRQFGALLKDGGCVLYMEGPAAAGVASLRTSGMLSTKPSNIDIKTIKGDWTADHACHSIKSWLKLSIAGQLKVGVIGCQNDAMASGAQRAFQELSDDSDRTKWLALPFTGCDGLPETGQMWVRKGLLAATVVIPPTAGLAMEFLLKVIRGGSLPPERTLISPTSCPAIENLRATS